jgi:uncharacterized protein (TIGR00369 family)
MAKLAHRVNWTACMDHDVIRQIFAQAIPHGLALGITLEELGSAHAVIRLPWAERLVGNPATGVLHGGAITTLMDSVCGAAGMCAMEDPAPMATLDLRIDYLRPATPRQDLLARADCYRVTRSILFVRGLAYHTAPDDPVVHATATFMINRPEGRR